MNRFLPSLVSTITLCLLSTWFLSAQAPAVKESKDPPSTAVTNTAGTDAQKLRRFQQVAFLVTRFLQEVHLDRHVIDDAVAKDWLTTYLDALDPSRTILLDSDHQEFLTDLAPILAKGVRNGDIQPAFTVHQRFLDRVRERVAWVQQRLDQPFDFTQPDFYPTDRSKAPWPASAEAANHLWEQRLKQDILQSQLTDFDSLNASLDDSENPPDPDTPTADKPLTADAFSVEPKTIEQLKKRYALFLKYAEQNDDEDIVEVYLSSLASTFDPHSQYMGPKTSEDFRISMQQSLVGIGAILTINKNGYCTIREIIPGGPADLDGRLQPNDQITGVAQDDGPMTDIVFMKLRDAVRLIRGKKDTTVRLAVLPAAKEASQAEISLVRQEVKVSLQKAKARIIDLPGAGTETNRLGIIELNSFYGDRDESVSSTTRDVRALIERLKDKNIQGLILDLRNNGGGLLPEAVRLAGLFIDQGPVVQVKSSRDASQVLNDDDKGTTWNGPLLVLTNKFSASASEIVAGALQNYGRALIVGDDSTHGKGTVQTVTALGEYLRQYFGDTPDVGNMKLTIQKFYLPNGHSTQLRGVIPDIILPSSFALLELGEKELPHAMPWDEIDPSVFSPVEPGVQPSLSLLQTRSQQRVQHSELFEFLKEQIDLLRPTFIEKKVPLQIGERLAQTQAKDELDKRREAWVEQAIQTVPSSLTIAFNENGTLQETDEPRTLRKKAGAGAKLGFSEILASDPQLNESLCILQDWIILHGENGETAIANFQPRPSPSLHVQ